MDAYSRIFNVKNFRKLKNSLSANYLRNVDKGIICSVLCKNERSNLIQKYVNVGMENDGRPFQNSLSYK